MILLDTHALLWLADGNERLGAVARRTADDALADDALATSAISFWETAMLARRGRLVLHAPVSAWRESLLEAGLQEIAVGGEIGILAAALDDLHPDPADRIIAATASLHHATLLTADQRLLDWPGALRRQDARR